MKNEKTVQRNRGTKEEGGKGRIKRGEKRGKRRRKGEKKRDLRRSSSEMWISI